MRNSSFNILANALRHDYAESRNSAKTIPENQSLGASDVVGTYSNSGASTPSGYSDTSSIASSFLSSGVSSAASWLKDYFTSE